LCWVVLEYVVLVCVMLGWVGFVDVGLCWFVLGSVTLGCVRLF